MGRRVVILLMIKDLRIGYMCNRACADSSSMTTIARQDLDIGVGVFISGVMVHGGDMGYLIELDLSPALNPRSYGGSVGICLNYSTLSHCHTSPKE